MAKFEKKFMFFLESLKGEDLDLMDTIMKGFELIYKKDIKENNNPYALIEIIDKPEPYYDISPINDKVEPHLTDADLKIIDDACKKFKIKPADIKDDYLLYYQHLPPYQYLDMLKNLTSWKTRAYYDDEKDEYYGKVKKGYEIPLDNKYGDSGFSSGGH